MPRLFPDATIEKTTTEIQNYSFDFVDEVPSSDSINTGTSTVTAIDSSGATVTSIFSGSPSFSGTTITQKLTAGTDGESYLIKYQAIMTTSAERREKYLLLNVRNPTVLV